MQEEINVLIGGEAGQGIVTIGLILAKSFVRSGYSIATQQVYESRIRGGHNTFAIRAGVETITGPRESIDILVALNEESLRLHEEEINSGSLVIQDEAFNAINSNTLKVPYKDIASSKYINTVALGATAAALGLKLEILETALEDYFGHKKEEAVDENIQTLRTVYDWFQKSGMEARPLKPVAEPSPRMMLNGNEAIALGAISAGVRFCAFYPMTPSTSIPLTLIANSSETGLVVEQAEDEIAAINMALGASYAGAPSIVATSGGGFALMTEGISLAGMTETPVVVVVAQRPGPATGLPTRTEQGDLNFVLHAGHGEFPRAVFAPGSIEECFHLTRKAFELAEYTQVPVFILTDQYLADLYQAVPPFDIDNLQPIKMPGKDTPVSEKYIRYKIAPSGVSPRLLPGLRKNLVVVDSDEHSEDGHITENLPLRALMVEKRLRKGTILRENAALPDYTGGDDPEILFVSWGSTKGVVFEAVSDLTRHGRNAAVLHFSQVWPLVPDKFLPYLERAKQVICVEGNATGQFAGLLRRETSFNIEKRISRYDGLPITREYIAGALQSLGLA